MANPHSTSTKPTKGGSKDKRLSENRSKNYKAGDRTRESGSPTNSRQKGTKKRVG